MLFIVLTEENTDGVALIQVELNAERMLLMILHVVKELFLINL
jgi:hypothetical protein